MFESLSIGGDPVGFRMIANEFALNAATIQRAGLLQECIIAQKQTLPDNIFRQFHVQLMKGQVHKPPGPWPKAVTEEEYYSTAIVRATRLSEYDKA
jgi:hypothetical protein